VVILGRLPVPVSQCDKTSQPMHFTLHGEIRGRRRERLRQIGLGLPVIAEVE